MDSKATKIGIAVIFVFIFVFAAWQFIYIANSEKKGDPVYLEQEAEKDRIAEEERAEFVKTMNENPAVLEEDKIEEAKKREMERELFKTREDMININEVNDYMKEITPEELERDMNSMEKNLSKGDITSAAKTAKILDETYDLNDYKDEKIIIDDVLRLYKISNNESIIVNLSCLKDARMYIYAFLSIDKGTQAKVVVDKGSEIVSMGSEAEIGEVESFSSMENGVLSVMRSADGYVSYRVPVTIDNNEYYCYMLYRKISKNWEILKFLKKDANSRGIGDNTYESYTVNAEPDGEKQTYGIKWRG